MKVKIAQLCLTLCNPWTIYSAWNSPSQNTGVGSFSLLQGNSQPRDRTQISRIALDSLPAESQWKPKNTGVDSLSILQGIFLTEESMWGLLHCRRILYQLSRQGSPTCLVLIMSLPRKVDKYCK